jgi:prepilin-type processing-associated H-X9-DG protein
LLVVISIIGMLMALLVPAVTGARNRARIAQCANNLHELASGVQQYDLEKGSFPGSAEYVNSMVTNWVIMVFPYIGQVNLWNGWRNPANNAAPWNVYSRFGSPPPRISQLVCPADAAPEMCPLSYVANCGMRDGIVGGSTLGLTAAQNSNGGNNPVPPDWPANGIFHNHCWYAASSSNPNYGVGKNGVHPTCQVRMSAGDVKDGLTNTLMLSENIQAGEYTEPYTSGNGSYLPGGSVGALSTIVEVYTGMLFYVPATKGSTPPTYATYVPTPPGTLTVDSPLVFPINVAKAVTADGNLVLSRPAYHDAQTYPFSRPSSMHTGGVNAAFCDGHTQFVRENVDPLVYFQLMTPDDQNFRPAGSQVQVSNADGYSYYRQNLAPLSAGSYSNP